MVFIKAPSLFGRALRPNGNDHGKDPDQGGILLYKEACSHGQFDCTLTLLYSKKNISHTKSKMTSIEELLSQKAKVDKEFWALLVGVQKRRQRQRTGWRKNGEQRRQRNGRKLRKAEDGGGRGEKEERRAG